MVIVRESLRTPDIELLSVSLRPFYLPREFPQLFVMLVYIHPKANVDLATQAMLRTVHQLQWIAPDAPNLIMGDFTHCRPGKALSNLSIRGLCDSSYQMLESMLWIYERGLINLFAELLLGSRTATLFI